MDLLGLRFVLVAMGVLLSQKSRRIIADGIRDDKRNAPSAGESPFRSSTPRSGHVSPRGGFSERIERDHPYPMFFILMPNGLTFVPGGGPDLGRQETRSDRTPIPPSPLPFQ